MQFLVKNTSYAPLFQQTENIHVYYVYAIHSTSLSMFSDKDSYQSVHIEMMVKSQWAWKTYKLTVNARLNAPEEISTDL